MSVTFSEYDPLSASNARFARFQSSRRPGATRLSDCAFAGFASITLTSRSAFGNGRGLISTVSTTEKIAVVAPIPKASVRTAMRANAGRRASERQAMIHDVT